MLPVSYLLEACQYHKEAGTLTWGSQGTEMLRNLPGVTQLINSRAGTRTSAELVQCAASTA